MAQPFKLPDLGEGIHEGEVVALLVKVGDRVQEGQPILEIETDKASVEIPSPFTGLVQEIRVKPGETVKVGSVLMVFGEGRTDLTPLPPFPKGKGGEVPSSPLAPAARGKGGETGNREGENRGESAPGRRDGQIAPSDARHGGARLAGVKSPVSPDGFHTPLPFREGGSGGLGPARDSGPVPASPATRRVARELGVDLRQVPPTGPAGLVTAEDVRGFAEVRTRQAEAPTPATVKDTEPLETVPSPDQPTPPVAPPLPDFGQWGPVERVALRSVRRAAARHLALAWAQIPHVTHQDEADITELEAFRRAHAAEVEAKGGKLTPTVLVMKAAVAALKEFPRFNSSLDMAAEEILLKHYYHLGVAVDTDRGLVVPVLRDVNQKSITELAVELLEVARRTRAGEATLEELQGGTFTLTNIGALGGTGFAPIINHPQVAILGMGRAKLKPVVLGDETDCRVVPRLMLPLVLAFDHRVLDGADAARFVGRILESLEHPDKLWLRI